MCKRNWIAALLLGGMLAAGTVFPGPGAGEVLVVHAAEDAFSLEEQEYQILLRIVEAEAGGEDITGKMLVAGVVMNRVTSEAFPGTVKEVVYEKTNGTAQFSPTVDGRLDTVSVSEGTAEAVARVLGGEDISQGALYFRSVHCDGGWFDRALNRVCEYGNHIFYTL
ncbi:MAG: cell wall hydrolase [Lachnospiraceae bacterium]|nr:cell wall hydrolase [Lachnospiraceae bacterium]